MFDHIARATGGTNLIRFTPLISLTDYTPLKGHELIVRTRGGHGMTHYIIEEIVCVISNPTNLDMSTWVDQSPLNAEIHELSDIEKIIYELDSAEQRQ